MKNFLRWLFHNSAFGLTFLRIVLGSMFVYAGYAKSYHSGYFIYYFSQKGFPVPYLVGPFISYFELIGGALLLLGLFTRYLGLIFMLEFMIATAVIALAEGVIMARFEFMMLTTCFVIATQGAGRFAIDRPGRWWEPFSERRRRQERWLWEGDANFSLPHDIKGQLLNINKEGASILAEGEDIHVGSPVTIAIRFSQFDLPQGPLKLEGTVRWISGTGIDRTIGILFDKTDPILEQLFRKEEDPTN